MPTLIELKDGVARVAADTFAYAVEGEDMPAGDVILSLARFQTDGERLLSEGRRVGVRLTADEAVEALAYDLPQLSLVALDFPKNLDGRAFSNARLLRERLNFTGQVRAVGDVLREYAGFMVRCGFDAFEPADGASANEWQAAAHRYRHAYQRGSDALAPAFAEREA